VGGVLVAEQYTADGIITLCRQLTGVDSYYPFGPQPECFRVGGKIFAEVYPEGVKGALTILLNDPDIPRERVIPMVTLRCTPDFGDFMRQQYPGAVLRPYHCPPIQQPYANTVLLDGSVPTEMIEAMVDHAYRHILGKLPKRVREEIKELEGAL